MLAIIETSSRFTVFHISGFGCDKFLMGVTSNVIAIKSQAKLNREGSESIWFLSGSNPIRKSGGNDWKYYVGKIKDPDMYLITQAIYIVLWGHIWNLNFENLGSWGRSTENQFPFRGDTIHACGKFGDKNERVRVVQAS